MATYRAAVRYELHRAFAPPFGLPLILLANAAMMTAAWFWLPRSWLFSMTGTAAFPLFLASWMYADVPATNVLGSDRQGALRALRTAPTRDAELVRLLRAKLFVLWLCVSVPCLAAAVLTGRIDHRPVTTAATLVGIVLLPLGPLRLASCIGLAFPYHPRPLQWRWRHRRTEWRSQLRWLVLISAPYLVVPFLLTVASAPSIWLLRRSNPLPGRLLSDEQVLQFVGLACAVSAVLCLLGAWLSRLILRLRYHQLIHYLEDVDLG